MHDIGRAQTEFDAAVSYFFHWALVAHPDDPVVLLNYAIVMQCVRRDYKMAERMYRRAVRLAPDNEAIHTNFVEFLEVRLASSARANLAVPWYPW